MLTKQTIKDGLSLKIIFLHIHLYFIATHVCPIPSIDGKSFLNK